MELYEINTETFIGNGLQLSSFGKISQALIKVQFVKEIMLVHAYGKVADDIDGKLPWKLSTNLYNS